MDQDPFISILKQNPRLIQRGLPDQLVWATSEASRRRGLSLYIVRSIVEKYGGTIDVDWTTNTLDIDVPEKERFVCAQELLSRIGDPSETKREGEFSDRWRKTFSLQTKKH